MPRNIGIIPLPAQYPELNPVETISPFVRDNGLSNQVFTSHDNIIDLCRETWAANGLHPIVLPNFLICAPIWSG